eukprot:Nk52_evm10s298 gene=Nk52_evmTU10s298
MDESMNASFDVGESMEKSQGDDRIVQLNIGGYRYFTTRETLTSKGENFFSAMLAGRIPVVKDSKGAYFIDRNGKFFEPLLESLRGSKPLLIPATMSKAEVLDLARFFLIDVREDQQLGVVEIRTQMKLLKIINSAPVHKSEDGYGRIVSLPNVKFNGISFRNFFMANSNFEGCTFQDCSFEGLKLENSNLSNCKIINCNAANTEFINTKFNQSTLVDTVMDQSFFRGSTTVKGSYLSRCSFQHAAFGDGKELFTFSDAILQSCDFRACTFRDVDFSGTNLQSIDMRSTMLGSVNFNNTSMTGVDFSEASIGVNFAPENENINLSRCVVSFVGAKMVEVSFNGSLFCIDSPNFFATYFKNAILRNINSKSIKNGIHAQPGAWSIEDKIETESHKLSFIRDMQSHSHDFVVSEPPPPETMS